MMIINDQIFAKVQAIIGKYFAQFFTHFYFKFVKLFRFIFLENTKII